MMEPTFENKLDVYNKCRDRDIISMLMQRDKKKNEEQLKLMLYDLYDAMSREELVHLIARRDVAIDKI